MAKIIKIHPDNPQKKSILEVVECLQSGGIIVYPTDTVYGFGCNLFDQKAIERICRIKSIDINKMHLSFICYDLSDISSYVKAIDNSNFRLMRAALPGPFTFILESSREVPKIFGVKKKQVGIRVPNHLIPREIVHELGNPILTTSVINEEDEDGIVEYMTDPSLIAERYDKVVDIVIDGGYGGNQASTVIMCDDNGYEVLRQGLGTIEDFI